MPKVRDVIAIIENDGWIRKRTRGSHRHYKHPDKPGIVTVAGNLGQEIAKGTWHSILKQAGLDRD